MYIKDIYSTSLLKLKEKKEGEEYTKNNARKCRKVQYY